MSHHPNKPRSRLNQWIRRSPREWLWALRRRFRPDKPYCVPYDGDLKLEVTLRDELSMRYALGQEFEPDISAYVRKVLRPGGVVIDVGANIGHFTLLAAKRVGPGGSVHAFEASPTEYQKLVRNVALNGFDNVETHQVAVCDASGTTSFHVCRPGYGLYNSLGTPIEKTAATIIVPCTSLDSYAEAEGLTRVDLLKIDVEGAELLVLQGADRLLSRPDHPIVVCEFCDPTLRGYGRTSQDLRRMFEDYGYRLYRYDSVAARLVLEPDRGWYDYDNLICVGEGEELRSRPTAAGD